jgi:hypothetical protein
VGSSRLIRLPATWQPVQEGVGFPQTQVYGPVETWRDDTDAVIRALSIPVRDVFSGLQCRGPVRMFPKGPW